MKWGYSPGTNALAYFATSATKKKRSITLAPALQVSVNTTDRKLQEEENNVAIRQNCSGACITKLITAAIIFVA